MKLGLLRFGDVPFDVAVKITEGLEQAFPNITCSIIDDALPLPEQALDIKRRQYHSNILLNFVQRYALQHRIFDCIIGVVDVDIFVSGLNFVFGEAVSLGRAALISLWRLRPEFYGNLSDAALFLTRAIKEAVHEVGHTLGLRHCPNPDCIMFFSNSIADTDRKQSVFCSRCAPQVASKT